jgi:tannase/feruloyl esterase
MTNLKVAGHPNRNMVVLLGCSLLMVVGIFAVLGISRLSAQQSGPQLPVAQPGTVPVMDCTALTGHDFTSDQEAPAVVQSAKVVAAANGLPEYCEVEGYVTPQVKFRLGLPAADWNGMYYQTGNGGRGGRLNFEGCTNALSRNFAVATTNMGHDGTDSLWGRIDPQLREDWGHRSTHVTAVAAKNVINKYYGSQPRQSIFQGCSTGGREGLSEVEAYPQDFDGVIAGNPAFASRLGGIQNLYLGQVGLDDNGQPIMTQPKLVLLHQAVLEACDDLNGDVKDGVIRDPRDCKFDPSVLACEGAETSDCLTPKEVDTVKAYYSGPRDKHGKLLYPYVAPYGAELSFAFIALQGAGFADSGLKNLLLPVGADTPTSYRDWDLKNPKNIKRLEPMARVYDPVDPYEDPNPKEFARHGGKLLMYHGSSDAGANFGVSIDYISEVASRMGGFDKINSWARLFMAPGMGHCGGGEGPNEFDALGAMTAWLEDGIAPDRIIATNSATGHSRPLVPYPKVPEYIGSGDIKDAQNYVASDPPTKHNGDINWVWDAPGRWNWSD